MVCLGALTCWELVSRSLPWNDMAHSSLCSRPDSLEITRKHGHKHMVFRLHTAVTERPWDIVFAIRQMAKQLQTMYTLWLFNIAMENGLFIDDFPLNTSIYKGFSMAMLNNQMVPI